MGWPRSLRTWAWRLGAPVFVAVFVVAAAVDAGPAYRARFGGGTPGTFTATREQCSKGCSWYGDFRSHDGEITRTDVLFSGDDVNRVGDSVPAKHTGGTNVYAVDGGWDWLILTFFAIGGIVLAAAWVWSLPPLARLTGARRQRWPRRLWYGLEEADPNPRWGWSVPPDGDAA